MRAFQGTAKWSGKMPMAVTTRCKKLHFCRNEDVRWCREPLACLSSFPSVSLTPTCGRMTESEVEQKLLTVAQHLLVSRRWPARDTLQLQGTTCASLSPAKRDEARFSGCTAGKNKQLGKGPQADVAWQGNAEADPLGGGPLPGMTQQPPSLLHHGLLVLQPLPRREMSKSSLVRHSPCPAHRKHSDLAQIKETAGSLCRSGKRVRHHGRGEQRLAMERPDPLQLRSRCLPPCIRAMKFLSRSLGARAEHHLPPSAGQLSLLQTLACALSSSAACRHRSCSGQAQPVTASCTCLCVPFCSAPRAKSYQAGATPFGKGRTCTAPAHGLILLQVFTSSVNETSHEHRPEEETELLSSRSLQPYAA